MVLFYIFLVFLFIVFIISIALCVRMIKESCGSFNSLYTPDCVLPKKVSFTPKDQKDGKAYMKDSSVVFCGLARDSSNRLSSSISMIKKLLHMFKRYKVVIVENDSSDDTRETLLNWAKEDPNVIILGCGGINEPKCTLNLVKTADHEITSSRIQKMAKIRNIYLEFIKQHLNDYDYMMVYDFDIVGNIYIDGLRDTFNVFRTRQDIHGLTANGIRAEWTKNFYYDPFAIFSKESPSCFDTEKNKRKDEKIILSQKLIPSMFSDRFSFEPDFGLISVKSAFAGLGIYRIDKILQHDASYNLTCDKITCEHTAFSESLGNIYINPKMILYVFSH